MNAVIKGAKAGQGNSRKAVIAADSAQSKSYIKILYGLSEGEVEGLANGLQSVYLEETPLQNPAGGWNFEGVQADFRHGTNDQTHIEGFPDISSETAINVELKSDTPWVRSVTNTDLDAIRLRFKWGPLREQNAENGDVNGITIQYAIDLQVGGGTWVEVLNTQVSDKTSANYERSHRIDLPKSDSGWTVRVRRITPNSTSEYISDKMYVDAITEVIDLKLSYPNTAMLGLQYDAETFSNVAKVAVDLKGIKLQVPSNYNPVARTYTGMWDGTFKRAYTNNPAWIYYDICTSKRYALGDRLTSVMLDKWSLYRLAQYCDQLVDDGKGGKEPRFTCNVYLQSTEDAYVILSKLAGVFRAISYWDGNSIVCDADIPQDTYFTYTRANVIDGLFEYTGTRARDRHTVAKVAWDNPKNHYKTEYAYVRDEAAIARLGVRIAEIDAWGCTSEGQAQRAGLWALKSEQLETRTVSFKVGLDGYIPQPGRVIEIADELFAGRANGGRISAVSADRKIITLDRDDVVCRAGDRLVVNGEDGKAQARIVSSKIGRKVTVTVAFDSVAAENVWVVDAQDLKTMKFRVMSITQDDKHQFSITALQYESAKYNAIDFGAFIDERPISIIKPTIQAPVTNVLISSETMVQQGLSIETMLITWDRAQGATKYLVEWRKDDGSWIKLPITGSNSVEVQGIYAGNYQARVTAISAFDVASLPTYSMITALSGKEGLPPALANITATGILFGYRLNWSFPATGALDTAYTEIEIASTENGANAAPLGLFAYPTTTHDIQGMQPNLTRYFRGRLIDRIGNVGPWSNWVGATTSADASAVLDILSGKITETQLHQNLQTKIDKIDTIAGLDGDISNLIDNITAVQVQTDQLNTALSQETQQRVTAIQDLNDGLTQEITDRQSGDTANLTALNNYKSSNDAALANVQQQVDTAVTATSSNTQAVQALDSRVTVAEDNANTAKTNAATALTKAEAATTEAGSAASLAQQASAVANQAADTADTASQNAATALSTANTAADQSSANASQIDALTAELGTKASTGALNQTNANVAEINERVTANTTKIDGVYAQVNPDMIGSSEDYIGSTSGYVGAWSQLTAQIEGDEALGQRVDAVVAQINENTAAITAEATARANADSALTMQINTALSQVDNAKALIRTEQQTRADADIALGSRIDTLQAQVGDDLQQSIATIQQELDVLADADSALSSRVDTVQAATATAQSSADQAILDAQNKSAAAQATADDALGKANTATQNIATVQTQVSTLTTQQSATATQVGTLQTTVGNNTASIQEVSESVDGLYAQKYIKLDVNGKVAGWGGANTGKESNFIVNFDSFAIGSGGSTGYYPFIFRATPYTDPVTKTVFPVGAYLKTAFMDYASVDTAHIKRLAVKSAQIDDLAVTTAKIGDLQVDTLKIKDNAVTVPVGVRYNTLIISADAVRNAMNDYAGAQGWRDPNTGAWQFPANLQGAITVWEAATPALFNITVPRAGGKCRIDLSLSTSIDRGVWGGTYVVIGPGNQPESVLKDIRMFISLYRGGTLIGRTSMPPTAFVGTTVGFTGNVSLMALDDAPMTGNAVYTGKISFGYIGSASNSITVTIFAGTLSIEQMTVSALEIKK
ncbi:TipJ family phage tail tip protein [Acinetobacter indicus]|uniref:TipJ family phage tail tip protein n=1 Tax=Acinetobacter indicus TaxID=756892 RepID=UPI000CEBB1FF|nr:phage tail protein [Acinetobacter indicus]